MRTRRDVLLAGVGLGVILALPGVAFAQAPAPGAADDPRPRAYQLIDQPAAPFSFEKRGGGMASLSDYAGKVLILYFGGLWCPDCVADGENVARLAQMAARDPDIEFLEIHTRNRFGRWGSVDAYFAETGHDYPVAFDPSREFARDAYRIEWYPSFLIIDRQGVIRAWRTDLGEHGPRTFFARAREIARA